MPESIEKILFLILGWSFGLLSPVIVDKIARKREVDAIKVSIIKELDELCYQILGAVFLIDLRFNQLNRDNVKWQLSLFKIYKDKPKAGSVLKFLEQAMTLDDEQLAVAVAKQSEEQGKGLALKKCHAPLLEANFSRFQHLNDDMQTRLLEISYRINILNQLAEEYQFFFQSSFRESNYGSSYDGVLGNINKALEAFRAQGALFIENILSLKVSLGVS
ncbi:hypothetical protein [Geothrix sp. PMB-07]|uniref:hypothetical protein n=1 Tax=Geothrix sp. PMB-07 TaxID=3068640 RepID=UPI0027426F4A|nr:hypothetical protein [Geothrix sp. PMB-07]WLT32749.1 hypothetical protein Q9293_05300 [Geothrix sp. PMB-07]